MKVKELLAILQSETSSDPAILEQELVVCVKGTSDQYTYNYEKVGQVGAGFDMDNGRYLIVPENLLPKKK